MGNKHKYESDKRAREESLNLLLRDYSRTKDRQDLAAAVSLVDEELVSSRLPRVHASQQANLQAAGAI